MSSSKRLNNGNDKNILEILDHNSISLILSKLSVSDLKSMIQTNSEIKQQIDENNLLKIKLDEFVSKIYLDGYAQIDENYSDDELKISKIRDQLKIDFREKSLTIKISKHFYIYITPDKRYRPVVIIENNKITVIFSFGEFLEDHVFQINKDYQNINKIFISGFRVCIILNNDEVLEISHKKSKLDNRNFHLQRLRENYFYITQNHPGDDGLIFIYNKFVNLNLFIRRNDEWKINILLYRRLFDKYAYKVEKIEDMLNSDQFSFEILDKKMERLNQLLISIMKKKIVIQFLI